MHKEVFQMNNSPKFFGFIAGSSSADFAKAVNTKLLDSQILSTWSTLRELQQDLTLNGKESIMGIHAILVTDSGFASNGSDEAIVNEFNFFQKMFEQEALYGCHIIYQTKKSSIFEALNKLYVEMPDLKYTGTRVLYNASDTTISNVSKLFNDEPYQLLSYGEVTKKRVNSERVKALNLKNKARQQEDFIILLAQKEMLETQLDKTQREIRILDRQIHTYAKNIHNENFDADAMADFDKIIGARIRGVITSQNTKVVSENALKKKGTKPTQPKR